MVRRPSRSSLAPLARQSVFVGFGILASGIATIVACSSDSGDSTFNEPPEASAESSTTPGPLVPEGGDGPTDGATVSCDPMIPGTFTPSWTPPVKQTVCMADEAQGYWDACLKDPNTKDDCLKYQSAHRECSSCIEGTNGSGPVQWRLERLYYAFNVAGCLALQGNVDCGQAYSAAVQCSRESCETCLAGTHDFKKFTDCQKQTQTVGVCKSYQNAQSDACQGIRDAGAATLSCFIDESMGETQETLFKRMAGYFCGP